MRGSTRRRRPSNKVKTSSFTLKGGLNIVDAPLSLPPGMCLAAINYELLTTEGYRRAEGYERYDGQTKPSEASYWILNFDTGSILEPQLGSIAHGTTSGAKGEVGLIVLTSGTWAGSNAAGYFVLFGVTGSFQDNEEITFTGVDDGFGSGFDTGWG